MKLRFIIMMSSLLLSLNSYSFFAKKITHETCEIGHVNINPSSKLKLVYENLELELMDRDFLYLPAGTNHSSLKLTYTIKKEDIYKEQGYRHTNDIVMYISDIADYKERMRDRGVSVSVNNRRRHVNHDQGYRYVKVSSWETKNVFKKRVCQLRLKFLNQNNALLHVSEASVDLDDEYDRCDDHYEKLFKKAKLPKCKLR